MSIGSEFAARTAVAVLILRHIRERLNNGEHYSPTWAPNLQSAMDVLLIPFDVVRKQIGGTKFQPTPDMLSDIEENWRRTFTSEELLKGYHLP